MATFNNKIDQPIKRFSAFIKDFYSINRKPFLLAFGNILIKILLFFWDKFLG